jgi:hypothetical protein
VLLIQFKEMEITRNEIRIVVRVVHNLPAVALQSVTSPVSSMAPAIYISLDPLRSSWLSSDLQ